MKRGGFWLVLVLVLVGRGTGEVRGEDARPSVADRAALEAEVSLADIAPTPEMWFYIQELRRYEDSRAAVRRKAEYRAQQRQQRIAAMKAFGDSKQRPRAENSAFSSMFTTRNDSGWPVFWPLQVRDVNPPGFLPRDSQAW
ncbi:MAG: hypothetical protein GTO03_06450 [Planctomycetales bacterium]|nr:hypothetical protein [Planctomycetales bacterium]